MSQQLKKKAKRPTKNEFIDDEAELSGDDQVSDDELELSDDDQLDPDLVDLEAKELGSDEEEEVRRLYHKQLETEDKRAVLLLQEHLEDNDVNLGQRRRRKFRWQTRDLMENSLKRHYDPDDDDSQEGADDDDDDDDNFDYGELKPRLRRPTAEALLLGSTKSFTTTTASKKSLDTDDSNTSYPRTYSSNSRPAGDHHHPIAGTSHSGVSDDSNSNTINSARLRPTATVSTATNAISDLNRFLFRDKEIVEALSTKETIIVTREEKDRAVQREIKRVLQSKSIFDQLYS